MTHTMRRFASLFLALPVITVCTAVPASAITVELAKKCREMAVKAHPPPLRLGNQAYAQAERDLFTQCVAHDGRLDNPDTLKSDDISH
ncbi:MAG TPA: hypothetical protein VGG11_20950 [Xanthobacteraceae bacterium]